MLKRLGERLRNNSNRVIVINEAHVRYGQVGEVIGGEFSETRTSSAMTYRVRFKDGAEFMMGFWEVEKAE